jgi:hypothetical protein
MKQMSVQARALHRASAIVGGLLPLSRYLGVPDQAIREWMFDVGSPPNGLFLRVIELVLDEGATKRAADGMSVASDTAANMTRL